MAPTNAWINWPAGADEAEQRIVQKISRAMAAADSQRDLIAIAQAQLKLLEDDMHTLQDELMAQRAARAPVHRLNDDVLTIIFQYSWKESWWGGEDTFFLPWNVTSGRVCKRWRNLILRTAYFWNKVQVRYPYEAYRFHGLWQLYPSTITERLDVSVLFDASCSGSSAFDGARRLLLHCASRVHRLHLLGEWDLLRRIFESTSPFPVLKQLKWSFSNLRDSEAAALDETNGSSSSLDLLNRLETLHLCGTWDTSFRGCFFAAPRIALLSSLKLEKSYLHVSWFRNVMQILGENLRELYISFVNLRFPDEDSRTVAVSSSWRCELPLLERLHLVLGGLERGPELLVQVNSLIIPNLKVFSLVSIDFRTDHGDTFREFLSMLSGQRNLAKALFCIRSYSDLQDVLILLMDGSSLLNLSTLILILDPPNIWEMDWHVLQSPHEVLKDDDSESYHDDARARWRNSQILQAMKTRRDIANEACEEWNILLRSQSLNIGMDEVTAVGLDGWSNNGSSIQGLGVIFEGAFCDPTFPNLIW